MLPHAATARHNDPTAQTRLSERGGLRRRELSMGEEHEACQAPPLGTLRASSPRPGYTFAAKSKYP